MLQLQSKSSKSFAPENLTILNYFSSENKAINVAFIAIEFDITDFQHHKIEIILLEEERGYRRKRETNVVNILAHNMTFRVAQRNTDGSKVSKRRRKVFSMLDDIFVFSAIFVWKCKFYLSSPDSVIIIRNFIVCDGTN